MESGTQGCSGATRKHFSPRAWPIEGFGVEDPVAPLLDMLRSIATFAEAFRVG